MFRKNHGYKIYKEYNIDDVFNELDTNDSLPDSVIYDNVDLKSSIKRIKILYELIKRDGYLCKKCGISSKIFALGKDMANRWHLDLYGGDDNEDMFTIDHIYPKSKGGENNINNYQLLCKRCNEKKSDNVDYIVDDIIDDNINTVKEKNFIKDRLKSLTEQIIGIFNNIKNKDLICIKELDNFTIGNKYKVIDIKIKFNKKNKIDYYFLIKNDLNKKIECKPDYFLTKKDFLSNKNKNKHIV